MHQLRVLQKLYSLAHNEIRPGYGIKLQSCIALNWPLKQQEQLCHLPAGGPCRQQLAAAAQATSSRPFTTFSSSELDDWHRQQQDHSSSRCSGNTSQSAPQSGGTGVSASCDVPPDHVLHMLYRNRQQYQVNFSSGSTPRVPPTKIRAGTVSPDEFHEEGQVLTKFYEEGVHGGLGRRFRRKVPLFQVIEFYANGTAVEEYKPRTPQQLGLHPRDVVLFAPLSRLAAPQRATIVVHEEKVLVKTEIVKAIITPDKAVLIKGRRTTDTQKLTQNILAANDQRLMAINLFKQQQAASRAAASQHISALGCGKAASASQLLRAAEVHGTAAAWEHLMDEDDADWTVLGRQARQAQRGVRSRRLGEAGGQRASTDLKDVPFGMLVLEVLLDATAEYFYTKVQHLNWMLESVAADIRQPKHSDTDSQAAVDKAHQLLPIQKFLTSLKNDVKETAEAIKAALADDDTLHELCHCWHHQEQQHWTSVELQRRRARLAVDYPGDQEEEEYGGQFSIIHGATSSRRGFRGGSPTAQVRMLTEMLESYDREIQSLEGSINEAEEDLDNTRALWHMQMDSRRNHIIMVNLWLSMLNISVMATTVLPAFFGMNLDSGLSGTDPRMFFMVCGSSLLLSALAYPASRSWYNRNWRRINKNELFEQKMLRTLLVQHIEDIDAIIRLAKRIRYHWIDRYAFRKLMMDTLGSRVISPAHIDFLWQAYDRDRDGFIEEAELIRPLNTYHSGGALSAADGLQLQPDLNSSSSITAVHTMAASGYQQYLQYQQQLLQQQQLQPPQRQELLPEGLAGLMSDSSLSSSMEQLLRSGGSSRGQGQRSNSWDEDWEGPSISDEEENQSRSGVLQRLNKWTKRRQKQRQRRQKQQAEQEQQQEQEREWERKWEHDGQLLHETEGPGGHRGQQQWQQGGGYPDSSQQGKSRPSGGGFGWD